MTYAEFSNASRIDLKTIYKLADSGMSALDMLRRPTKSEAIRKATKERWNLVREIGGRKLGAPR